MNAASYDGEEVLITEEELGNRSVKTCSVPLHSENLKSKKTILVYNDIYTRKFTTFYEFYAVFKEEKVFTDK